MAFAYDTASAEARKNADRQKGYYDYKVRYVKLEVGDRVLVKNVGLRGRQKLADMWEHFPYVFKSQPVPAIPVYEVFKENTAGSKPRVLHCNMLLPFTELPCPRTHTPEKEKPEKKRIDQGDIRVVTPEPEESDYDSSSQSSAEEEDEEVIRPEPDNLPIRLTRRQGGLKPPLNRKEVPPKKPREEQRGRPQRERRDPKRLNKDEFVTEFTLTVPASQVTYL